MKRLFFILLTAMLCMSTAFAQGQSFVGKKYTIPSSYTLTVFWPEGDEPGQTLLEDIQTIFFSAYPAMREIYGTTDRLDGTIYLVDAEQMPQNIPAYTTDSGIFCSKQFIEQCQGNLNCLVHELFHVVQNGYPAKQEDVLLSALCEGLADYARDKYGVMEEEGWQLPDYAPGMSVTDGYTVTAAFLKWTCDHYDDSLCLRLNRILHEGRYTDTFWQDLTGQSLEALWDIYAQA